MERPSAALIGSAAVHTVAIGLIVLTMLNWSAEAPVKLVQAVPVSIVSETMVVEAAPGGSDRGY